MQEIKRVYMVMSGKGGVGKTSVACLLAQRMAMKGVKVGLMGIDICGPSVPTALDLRGSEISVNAVGMIPVTKTYELEGEEENELQVISPGFMLGDEDAAVIWRGPKK